MLRVEEHSRASVATARLVVGTRERIAQRRRLEAIVADLEADLEAVASIVTTARVLAMKRTSAGNFILSLHHSGTRT